MQPDAELAQGLQAAQWEAACRKQEEIRSEHLLLGVFHIANSQTTTRLERLGVNPRRERLAQASGGPQCWPPSVPMPALTVRLSPEATRVLSLARQDAVDRDAETVGLSHLIMGLLREGRGLGAHLLFAHGLTLEKAERTLFP